jgi:hypothetical protein
VARRAPPSFDHLIRPLQERWRDRQTQSLRGLEIDSPLELRRLFNWQISGPGTPKYLAHVRCAASRALSRHTAGDLRAGSGPCRQPCHSFCVCQHRLSHLGCDLMEPFGCRLEGTNSGMAVSFEIVGEIHS